MTDTDYLSPVPQTADFTASESSPNSEWMYGPAGREFLNGKLCLG